MHKLEKFHKLMENGSNTFILVYMEGCGPCNATRPEWAKLESVLKHQYANNNNLVIVDVNKDFLSHIKHIGEVDGFPTMKYIGKNGKEVESYENSPINKKDRSTDSFVNWIENKINTVVSTVSESSPQHVLDRLTKNKTTRKHHTNNRNKNKKHYKNKQRGGKWTRKYKKSINCKRPKGFSQKQYCKYGRR